MKINILGYGVMAKQIAALLFLGGHELYIWNDVPMEKEALFRQIKLLKKSFNGDSVGAITFLDSLEAMEDNLTIEAVVEDLKIKRRLYFLVKERVKSSYFTNTSSFSPQEIGPDVSGLHFFNPISLRIAEVCIANARAQDDLKKISDLLLALQFKIVDVHQNRGYIGNYLLFSEISSALKLIEKFDYPVESVSAIYSKLYTQRNIFAIIDLIGIDVVNQILVNLKEKDDSFYLPDCFQRALEKNILGKKNKTSIKMVLR